MRNTSKVTEIVKSTYRLSVPAAISAAIVLIAVGAADVPCQNRGYGIGYSDCATVDLCSNHKSSGTCLTARTVDSAINTGTVEGYFIKMVNYECSWDTKCYWDLTCKVKPGTEGDSHNALEPVECDCDTGDCDYWPYE
jgi:hypothetical protein